MKNEFLFGLHNLTKETKNAAKVSTFCLLFSACPLYASGALDVNATQIVQQSSKKITGTIVDAAGEPVIGASIQVKGQGTGTISDFDGRFTVDVPQNGVLLISYIGYASQEVEIKDQTTINVVLQEDSETLDEVVVVGYGTMRKSDVTGSISITKGEEMVKTQSFSALDNLRGKAAGVNIFSNSGQPGGGSRVMIRGISTINSSSDPLYVVDGVVMENFKYVNPNDIERIEVLKDASATAIYGARGANGVIMVTTKRGMKGEEGTKVSYSGSVSIGTLASKMDVLNADEWCEAYMIGLENQNKWGSLPTSPETIAKYKADGRMDANGKWVADRSKWFTDRNYFDANGNPIYNTDWQSEATRVAVSHNHQLSIQQGGKNSSVGAFLNYTDQQGIMLNSYMKRINAKMTYDAQPTKWLSTGINLLVNHTWGQETPEDGGGQDARRTLIEMLPWMPVKLNGEYTTSLKTSMSDMGFEGMSNPVMILENDKRMNYRTQIFGNAALTFHLAPNLDLKTQLGIDNNKRTYKRYSPSTLVDLGMNQKGVAEMYTSDVLYWQEETYVTYNLTKKEHRLNAMAGLSWQERQYNYNRSYTENFSDDFFGWNNMAAGTKPSAPESDWDRWAMNSYFLRGAYSYSDLYSATVTARVDGSSKFGENNKYAFFPSVGLAWNISNEKFMKNVKNLDLLKLHASYGVTGNSEIGTYKSLSTVESGTILQNGGRVPYAYINSISNPNLKWERTKQFDIGVNLNLFRNRLTFDVSYYNKLTDDLLLDRPLPYSTGFTSVMDNIGSVRNQGLDFMMTFIPVQTKDFNWSATVNANFNKNKIVSLGENDEDIQLEWFVDGNTVILRKGESLGSFWGKEREGVYTEGDKIGQAKRADEKKILGKGIPDWTGSFINEFSYKNWDMTIDLQFVAGVQVLQRYMHSTSDRFGITNGLKTILTDSYNGSNPGTTQQAIFVASLPNGIQNTSVDSKWVANGSYLRGNLIQLGYTFDGDQCKRFGLSALRIYASVNNAFVIHAKDFQGFDPEGSSLGSSQWGQNQFFFQYPKPRTYTLGLNLTF